MSEGSEFQVVADATEKTRLAEMARSRRCLTSATATMLDWMRHVISEIGQFHRLIVVVNFGHQKRFYAAPGLQMWKRNIALQRSKKLTNLITLTAYSILPKSASSTTTKSPLQAENLTFLARASTKNTAHNSPKHIISIEKFIIFFWRCGLVSPQIPPLVRRGTPSHTSPLALFNQALRPPRIPARYDGRALLTFCRMPTWPWRH